MIIFFGASILGKNYLNMTITRVFFLFLGGKKIFLFFPPSTKFFFLSEMVISIQEIDALRLALHTFLLENLKHFVGTFSLKIDELSDKLLAAAADTDGQTKCT